MLWACATASGASTSLWRLWRPAIVCLELASTAYTRLWPISWTFMGWIQKSCRQHRCVFFTFFSLSQRHPLTALGQEKLLSPVAQAFECSSDQEAFYVEFFPELPNQDIESNLWGASTRITKSNLSHQCAELSTVTVDAEVPLRLPGLQVIERVWKRKKKQGKTW